MDLKYAKIESWHALRPYDHFGPTAYCGRSLEGAEVSDELPAGKSCETCARIVLRLVDDADKAAD